MNRQTLARREKVLEPEHPSTLTSMRNLTFTWKPQSRNYTALRLMSTSDYSKKKLRENHPGTLWSLETSNQKQCHSHTKSVLKVVHYVQVMPPVLKLLATLDKEGLRISWWL